jgi:hypothetical protein
MSAECGKIWKSSKKKNGNSEDNAEDASDILL